MVKVKEPLSLRPDGSIDVAQWLHVVGQKGYVNDLDLIRRACTLSQLASLDHAVETGESCLQRGLAMADILADLEVDQETLAAAIIFVSVHYAELSLDDVEEQLGGTIARLVSGVEKMTAMPHFNRAEKYPQQRSQLDNVRKMLLAMVDDVRVVLIKLAERLCLLRTAMPIAPEMRQQIAFDAMEIYAPLANRLGIGAIKWEMEDLAFRHLHPEAYKAIAKGLNAKRLERDRYVHGVLQVLEEHLQKMDIQPVEVYGRSKHIHSIYRKMMRKKVSLQQIYDATAVRILVRTTAQCYEVLGLIERLWRQVPHEFDDYIIHPKQNGYQSLHTAVEDADGRIFEVQIRTFEMHEQAEMGVAAHWKYKEGAAKFKASYERKIEWLREVLAWHRDVSGKKGELSTTQFIEDRVYVFTPNGDVLDLPQGVTALDFAYHLHSQIGHRCRGAKVNDSIVPLTYQLKTGDRVEILTGREAKPSRDWIRPQSHYLKTSRAKAKVLHWFNQQDHEKHRHEGQILLEKALKTFELKMDRAYDLVTLFKYKTLDELYIALGRGELKWAQLLQRLSTEKIAPPVFKWSKPLKRQRHASLCIEGVGHLLTKMARCCQPVPGDEVTGYITLGRGVSVHQKKCPNILHATDKQRQRLVGVTWGEPDAEGYLVDILIKAVDRATLLRDLTSLLAIEKAHIHALNTQMTRDQETHIKVTVETQGGEHLARLLAQLAQLPDVLDVKRYV